MLTIDLGITYNQLYNNLTSQAATMTTNRLPNDVLSNLDPLALIILIPLCDLLVRPRIFYPLSDFPLNLHRRFTLPSVVSELTLLRSRKLPPGFSLVLLPWFGLQVCLLSYLARFAYLTFNFSRATLHL